VTDFFIESLQINDANVGVVITETSQVQSFVNSSTTRNRQTRQVVHPLGMEAPSVSIKFTLYADSYANLVSKDNDMETVLLTQVSSGIPLRVRTSDVPIYLSHKDIFLVLESPSFMSKSDFGGHAVEYTLTGKLHGISNVDGGDIDPLDPWA